MIVHIYNNAENIHDNAIYTPDNVENRLQKVSLSTGNGTGNDERHYNHMREVQRYLIQE